MGTLDNRRASHHFYIIRTQRTAARFTLDGFHVDIARQINLQIDDLITCFDGRAQFRAYEYQNESNHKPNDPDNKPSGRPLRAEGA